jgi:hypothetical protein
MDGALTVVSGHDGHHRILIANHTNEPVYFWTNGQVTAHVVDPATLRVVGVSVVAQFASLVCFGAEAHGSALLPLLVGTASVDPRLGYKVPPGTWALRALLQMAPSPPKMAPGLPASPADYLTPPMSFEVA